MARLGGALSAKGTADFGASGGGSGGGRYLLDGSTVLSADSGEGVLAGTEEVSALTLEGHLDSLCATKGRHRHDDIVALNGDLTDVVLNAEAETRGDTGGNVAPVIRAAVEHELGLVLLDQL